MGWEEELEGTRERTDGDGAQIADIQRSCYAPEKTGLILSAVLFWRWRRER